MPFTSQSALPDRLFDICIIGAGPAGSTAAFLLARQGFDVALLDRACFPREKTCGDGITPRGARILKRIGVFDQVAAQGFACRGVDLRSMGPAGQPSEFTIAFDCAQADEPSEMLVVPRLKLDDLLLRHAMTAGPTLFEGIKAIHVETAEDHACVVTDSGQRIRAHLVVLATGAESQLLRACGLLDKKPPIEHAARAYFEGVHGLTDRAVLFFDGVDLPGYGWIFPTSPTSANIGCGVFVPHGAGPEVSPRPLPQLQRLEQILATHPLLKPMLADARQAGPIRAYPLRTDFRPELAGRDRLLVIGEAAGLVNPITGEGIDYALESAEFLAAAVAAHWTGPRAQQSRDALNTVQARRITEHYRDQLSRRFTKRFALYRAIQRHGLSPANASMLLTHLAQAPALQRLVIDALFGRIKLAQMLRPAALWQIIHLIRKARRPFSKRASS